MDDLENRLLALVSQASFQPAGFKNLARQLGLKTQQIGPFRLMLNELVRRGKLEKGKRGTFRGARSTATAAAAPEDGCTGVFRKSAGGFGFVRPHAVDGTPGEDVFIPERFIQNAITGDTVLFRVTDKVGRDKRGPAGQIVRVVERATNQFVGTYFEREGESFVRVDGTVFSHSVYVGDPGAKGARPNDKVVFEMIRFPSTEDRGEGVITEILGPRGQPGVDTLSVIRSLGLPDAFPEDVLNEAREAAAKFNEKDLGRRRDFTDWLTITIDPADARDFDDAVCLRIDPKSKHWELGVHIADVGHFAPPGSALDREARRRGTSVYLPQLVIPMFPEVISNSLASLQQGKVRFTKTVLLDLTPTGQVANASFADSAIKVRQRFTYEQVFEVLTIHDKHGKPDVEPDILTLLLRMRELALILHKRRLKRGALELNMPQVELTFDEEGRVTGGYFQKHDISHQMIEEFMLAANEAVAGHLDQAGIAFLRRVHPAPDPAKLRTFAEFARILGYKVTRETDRFTLQRILHDSADKPESYAVHYALLRSLKQAVYSPLKDDHYALASENYCHFTSPIRRYPDLTVHRLLGALFHRGRAGSNSQELAVLGDHCTKMERRAELAERELTKLKLLTYLSERLGTELEVVITGVADYGFFGQADTLPIEGMVHISTLPDDYYYFDEASHSLTGQRSKRRYRLGDKVKVTVVRVDLQRRQLDFRLRDDASQTRLRPHPKGRVTERGRR